MTVLKTSLRSFFAHKGRMVLSGLAIALSVAFVCGTLVFTDTMNATFGKFFGVHVSDVRVAAAEDDRAQRTGRGGVLPAAVVEEVRRVEGTGTATGRVFTEGVTVVDTADGENLSESAGGPTFGADWGEHGPRGMELTEGAAPGGPAEAVLDADTAERGDVAVGDTLSLHTLDGTFDVRVSGLAAFRATNPGAAYVLLETVTARERLLGDGELISWVEVDAAAGVGDEELKSALAAALGDRVEVTTKAEQEKSLAGEVGGMLDVIRYAMLGFAGIAVLVGIFLIVNTFSMLVAQRTREIGLLRAIGAGRRQVNRSVLTEALLLGLLGSALGVAGGVGLAVGLMELMTGMGMRLDTSELTIAATTPVVGLTVGVVTTLVAAFLPARRASRVAPMAALRDAGNPADGGPGVLRTAAGVLLLGGGGAALAVAAAADASGSGAAVFALGVLLTLVGAVVAGPLLAAVVVRLLGRLVLRVFGPVGRMAERNALRNPRRTGATAAALTVGLALVTGLSVVGSSMVASANEQLDRAVGADFIVETEQGDLIGAEAAAAVHAVEGLRHVTEYRVISVRLTTADGARTETGVAAADPTYAEDLRSETVAGNLADAYRDDAISVSEGFAADHGLSVGDTLTAEFVGGDTAELTLAAITSEDTLFDQGAMYLSTDTARRYLPAELVPPPMLMFGEAADGREAAAYAALKTALDPYPQVTVRDQADFKELLEDQIAQLLNIVYALLGLAVIVAVLGVVNTLALSVVERTREIGLSRAIGLSRRQLRRMVRLESLVIALFGAVLGVGLGMSWGVTAQQLLSLKGFGVLEIPWTTIATVFAGAAAVGVLAALIPAFRAGRMNVLRAIAE